MNGVHDMGGMHGFGRVVPEENEPVFHAEWEGRVFALQLSRFGGNIDERRFFIEQIRPERYLRISYYERWLDRALRYADERGLISRAERQAMESAHDAPELASLLARAEPPREHVQLAPSPNVTGYARPIASSPSFAIGTRVRARNIHPATHTRLPRYARGKAGTITADHGGFVFPDTNAIGEGEQPRRLYTVLFSARELWGDAANARDSVSIDLWEPYLEQA